MPQSKKNIVCACCKTKARKTFKGNNKYCSECSKYIEKLRKPFYEKIHKMKQKIGELEQENKKWQIKMKSTGN